MNLVLTSHSMQGWLCSPRVPIDVGLPHWGRVLLSPFICAGIELNQTHPCQGLGLSPMLLGVVSPPVPHPS